MNHIGERIKAARKKAELSQTELANMLNISKQLLYRYENNRVNNIPSDKIEGIARITQVSPAFLMGWTTEMNPKPAPEQTTAPEPQPEESAAAMPEANDSGVRPIQTEAITYWRVGDEMPEADFHLLIQDDCMTGDSIFPGAIVFIHRQPTVKLGEIGAIQTRHGIRLRRIIYTSDTLVAVPSNPAYPEERFSGDALKDVRILGKAVACQFSLNKN